MVKVGTMPQGIALSPRGDLLAVLESGVNPATLRILSTDTLNERAAIPLKGAFGQPVWADENHVIAAGANADAILNVDVAAKTVTATALGKDLWPAAVAIRGTAFATANDGAASVTLGTFDGLSSSIRVGDHPADVAFSADGKLLYASVRQTSSVVAIDTSSQKIVATISVGLHPGALAFSSDGSTLYVAESDDDSVGEIDTRTQKLIKHIAVGLHQGRVSGYGASPNALLVRGNDLLVSLGAENAVAIIRNGHVVERIPAGWYPTGVALAGDGTLYVANGKGESAPPNPQLDPKLGSRSPWYVGKITTGSVRAIPAGVWAKGASESAEVLGDAMPQWTPPPHTIVRASGPVHHVIYIIKENRAYDQILGDVPSANGDASLASFGKTVTPNQHAIVQRFGIFDNAYTNSQVSADGHNWTDAAFANDYVERFWPPSYGDRRDAYDLQTGQAPDVPHSGYIWDAAKRANITYRDYGEDVDEAPHSPIRMSINTFPGLTDHFDPRYIGWDLDYSDLDRLAEWRREFRAFVANGKLPQLEIVYLPNDHTSYAKVGKPTPQAYIATNDWATGQLVEDVSRSPYWKSTAIFIVEDDAQNGPDHVSDQRSTFYVASPYAKAGVHHAHYSTVSVVHTIELLLGLQPLSIYDATARPMYEAFEMTAGNGAAFAAVKPTVDMNARNTKAAYGAAISAKLDLSKPDAVDPKTGNDILAHLVQRP